MASKNQTPVPLVTRISQFIRRFVVISDTQAEVVSHYVLHTHQFSERCQNPYTTPYLFVNSAQKGSGKTLLGIDILGSLCRNFESVNNVTAATLFRLTELKATIGIDEIDVLFSGNRSDDDLVSVANTGYRKGGYVPRADPKSPDGVRRYHTFSPKVFVGIDSGTMKDTTRDRCIPINMRRATDDERATIQRWVSYRVEDELDSLNQEIWNWSLENTLTIRDYEPKEMMELSPRQWEICHALLQVAHATGREKELRAALLSIYDEQVMTDDTPEETMLMVIRDLFESTGRDKLSTAEILNELKLDERFRHWTPTLLTRKLGTFGVRVKATSFPPTVEGPRVQKGITRGECVDVFNRYLS